MRDAWLDALKLYIEKAGNNSPVYRPKGDYRLRVVTRHQQYLIERNRWQVGGVNPDPYPLYFEFTAMTEFLFLGTAGGNGTYIPWSQIERIDVERP